ncbi:ABC transporter ATP-binding protein [Halarchaeum sp. CBA1220]|uniref:ABC transporter ATP-binding protein n=1 Tax=Halarchaeum sp. CBA1220 TaxID=1853682 RepID=UPI0021069018|nr:ABC transporter ATP-binding protein [Halarchaeum sp. CBA1220]
MSDDTLLDVSGLSVGFEGFDGYADVVGDVDLRVERGEVVTIVGETGCGKSVTTKAITGLLDEPPAHVDGDVEFDGMDLRELSEAERDDLNGDRLGMVSQNPLSSLNPVFTVGEQLTDTAQFGGSDDAGLLSYLRRRHSGSERSAARERVLEMLREVQMPDPEAVIDSYPSELSGGMRQRALIAQALLNEPDLLIADEPGSALDVTVHDRILSLLTDVIAERDMSVLMITHNLGVARQISDRIYIMYGGRIVESAPTEEIFTEARHPYTQGLIASIPRLSGEPMAGGIDGSVPEYTDPPSGCRFHPRCPYADDDCRGAEPPRTDFGEDAHAACVRHVDDGPTPTVAETKRRLMSDDTETDASVERTGGER